MRIHKLLTVVGMLALAGPAFFSSPGLGAQDPATKDPAAKDPTAKDGVTKDFDRARAQEAAQKQAAKNAQERKALDAYRLLKREYGAALMHYNYIIPSRRTERKRKEAYDKYFPKPQVWGPRFHAIHRQYPKTQGAAEGLIWVVQHFDGGPQEKSARDILLKDHLSRPQLVAICEPLSQPGRRSGRADLEWLLTKSPVDRVKATALKYLCEQDLAIIRSKPDKEIQARLEDRLTLMTDRFSTQNVGAKTVGQWAQEFRRRMQYLSIGQEFLDWKAKDLSGNPCSLEDFHGKVVLVFFWKSSGISSRRTLEHVKAMANKWSEKPFQVLGVSGDVDLARAVRWRDTLDLQFPNWHAPSNVDKDNVFGVKKWPSFFVLDEKGKILAAAVGLAEAEAQAAKRLKDLKEKPSETPGEEKETHGEKESDQDEASPDESGT